MGFSFYQLISELEVLTSKVINVESVFIAILIMVIVNESILFDFIKIGLFSFIILFAIIFIYSQSVITKTLYPFLPLFLSITIDANKTSIGGFNTFLAFLYGVFETVLFSGYSIVWLIILFIYYSGNSMRDCDAYTNHSVRAFGN